MSFQQALSGLNAASKNLDAIGNNVANTSTVGFKSSQAQFADVFASSVAGGGGTQIGIGTKLAAVVQQFTQGNVTATNNPLDVAINGDGFFRISNGGSISYSRNGQFQIDKGGFLVTSQGFRVTGYGASASGAILTGALTDIQLPAGNLSPQTTAAAQAGINLDSRLPIPPTTPFNHLDPTSYNNSTSMSVFDSLGNAQTYSLYFVKSATANTWTVQATLTNPAGTTTAQGLLTTLGFSTSGALTSGSPATEALSAANLGTGAAALTFTEDFAGSTQFGSPFGVNALAQDGYASGQLTGFSIAADGILKARYSNGQSVNRGQIVLSGFPNAQGLAPQGNNQFVETSASGAPLTSTPSSGRLGALQASAVEDSNVDLTAELVNMITAQRNYQANAQTIKTQDQILQTLVNLR